jgi:hypothetical protein
LRGGGGGIELDFVFEELHKFVISLVELVFEEFVLLFELDILMPKLLIFKALFFVVFFENF